MRVLSYLPRFRKAYRELETLKERESWPRWKIESFQLDRINALWRHAITHVPYYRKLASKLSLPPSFSNLPEFKSKVPVLPRSAVKDRPLAFISERAANGRWHHTGGSTGTPMDIYWAHEAHMEVLRTKYRFYSMWDIDIFDRMVFLWGHGASFSPGLAGYLARIKQPVEDRLRGRLRLSAYRLGRNDLRRYLRRIAAFHPLSIYGYANAIYLLAREAEAFGFHCDSLKIMILTAEPLSRKIIATAERAFGVPAIAEYGSIECGFIAGEWADKNLHVREDIALVETLPRNDRNFDIVLTVLTNPSFPLIRYSIADVTDAMLEKPPIGFAILKNVAGRENDIVISRNGRYLHPTIFEEIFEHTPEVRRYQVRQKIDGSLLVLVEKENRHTALDADMLAQKLSDLIDGYHVKVDVVREVPSMASGKHRWIISELRNEIEASKSIR